MALGSLVRKIYSTKNFSSAAGQPQDIDQQIQDLVEEYISMPNTLILAVTQATVDIETSEAIKAARWVTGGHRPRAF